MVLDSSAVLAIFYKEEHGTWCAKQLDEAHGGLRMSTVNLAECLILVEDCQDSVAAQQMQAELESRGVAFIPPDTEQARIAAQARHRYPLNLGDCFAYALAQITGDTLLTLDRDFKSTDISVLLPPRR